MSEFSLLHCVRMTNGWFFGFFFLSLSLVTWAVCMVCQETTVLRSLPEAPMWPLSSDSSWNLWISTGKAPAPSSLTKSFSVSTFSVPGDGLWLCFCSARKTVLVITYHISQEYSNWQLCIFLMIFFFPVCFSYQHSSLMYQLFYSSCDLLFGSFWVIQVCRMMR